MSAVIEQTKTVQPRKAVLAMPEYHPPLAGRDALRLDFNENTFAPSPSVLRKLQQLTSEAMTIYPEREPVERIVADHFGLQRDRILLTNGVDEAIHLVACAFLDEGDEALICTPTFFMYDVSISLMTSGLKRVQSDDSLTFPFERFLAAITPKTKLIIHRLAQQSDGRNRESRASASDRCGSAASGSDGRRSLLPLLR